MNTIKIKNPEKFCRKLEEYYLNASFGTLPKREIELLFLHLLEIDGQFAFPADLHKACRVLKTGESRLRGMVRDAQLRYNLYDEEKAKKKFVDLVNNGRFEKKGNKFTFIVRDSLLRLYFEEWVAGVNGFTDSSFNKDLVIVSDSLLIDIITKIKKEDIEINKLIEKLPAQITQNKEVKTWNEILKNFIDEFGKSAGKEAGALSIKAIATGLKYLLLGI